MKARTILGMITVIIAAVSSGIAQELRITTTAANTVSSKIIIDLPDLTGNPLAIIIATPIENAAAVDAHPIGAWYYNGKWGIFNTDHAAMPLGVQFRVQYFPHAGPGQFLQIFSKENISNGRSYIDSAALNDNPTAVVKIFQNYAPDNRAGYYLNRVAATAAYDPVAGRWYVANINAERVVPNTAYNILITSPGAIRVNDPITAEFPSRNTSALTKPAPTPTPAGQTSIDPLPSQMPATVDRPLMPVDLTFDNLNDFVARGLPAAGILPAGTIDQMAAAAAKEISRSDDRSLPMLLPALQAAGFTVIDRKGKVLLKPMDSKGQGLGFYDFEAVGSLRLAQKGVAISLEKLAAGITKETPELSATQFADLMLKELRANANDSDNTYMRFYARLIVELGKSSAEPIDLLTAPVSQIKLSVLQASLMIRRLQGTLYALRNRIGSTGIGESPLLRYSQFTSGLWRRTEGLSYRPISMRVSNGSPCNLTSDQALILDAAAIHLTTWNGSIVSAFNSPAMTKLGAGVQAANAALAWHKLVASVTMMKGEIHVQDDPLIRTINSDTSKLSNRRLMVARIWSEVGDVEALNCLRPTLNLLTGLDFNLPTGGPLGDVSIEWHFAGDNETRVNDAATRNTNSFVAFESDKGKDPNPQKQVTDDLGLSKMWLVGKAKVPAIMYEKKPAKVEKKADVYVAVTLKSAKDFKQNVLDFSGFVLGVAQAIKGGDTIGFTGVLISAGAEIGFRTPYVAARATIPVIDHEPCDGQWIGAVTYTQIKTYKHTIILPPKVPPNSGGTGYFGGSTTTDQTVTLSGTIHVNSKDGRNSLITSNADEVLTMNTSHTGAGYCDKKMGVRSTDSSGTEVKSASGSSQGFTTVSIFFGKDYYTIGVNPMTVKAVLNSSTTNTHTGCNPGGESYSGTSTAEYVASGITGKAVIGDDPGVLSGSTTTTSNANPDGKTVTTITWNLRRCN